jgi:hypothetical protein
LDPDDSLIAQVGKRGITISLGAGSFLISMYGEAPRTSFALRTAVFAAVPVDVWAVAAKAATTVRHVIAPNRIAAVRKVTRWFSRSSSFMMSSWNV